MPRLGLAMPDRRKKGKNLDCLTTRSHLDIPYFFVVCTVANKNSCSTTGKPTRSFATERVSLDSV
jgi:hypothetical protein